MFKSSYLRLTSSERYASLFLFFLTISVYGLALSVMLALCVANGRDPVSTLIIPMKDPTGYAILAQNLLTYKAFTHVPPPPFILDALRTPGYPLFLASTLFVARTPFAVPLVQMALVGLTGVLIFKVGARLFSHGVGLVAALLYILDPAVMLLSFQYMSETLFMFLFMLFLFILLSRPIQPTTPRSLFYAGILLGVVTLVRPITQFLPLFVLAFIFFLHKGSWKASRLYLSLGAFSLGMILIVTPWMARNRLHAGEFQISVIGPYNLTYYVSLYLAAKYGVPFEVVRAQYQSNITRARSVGDPSSTVEFTRQNMEYVSRGIGGDIAGYLRFHLVNTLPFLTASSWKVPVIYYRSHVRENPLPPPSLAGYPNVLLGARLGPVIAILLQRPPEWFYGLERLARVLLFAFAALPLWFEGRDRRIVCLFLFGLILYFAFLTGPVSHARYRLPGEPSLFLLGLWGIEFVRRRWRGQAGLGTPPSCLS